MLGILCPRGSTPMWPSGATRCCIPMSRSRGRTVIREDGHALRGPGLRDCTIGQRVEILDHCIFVNRRWKTTPILDPSSICGPVVVRRKGKVGNFVEMKKTELGEGSKANHLSYLGDATIGQGVNIGAGTITQLRRYKKFQTVVGDGVFIGSDIAAGSPGNRRSFGDRRRATVTQDVPADALVIAPRAPGDARDGLPGGRVAGRSRLLRRSQ